jgi:hypothetical protein
VLEKAQRWLRVRGLREDDLDAEPAAGSGLSGEGGAVRDRDGPDDGQSEPVPVLVVGPAGIEPLEGLEQAPVNVNVTSQRADNVLAVPVNALLALAGGGYGVDVVTGSASRLVGVTTGLYSSTLVQVSGPGLRAGLRVAVPSS